VSDNRTWVDVWELRTGVRIEDPDHWVDEIRHDIPGVTEEEINKAARVIGGRVARGDVRFPAAGHLIAEINDARKRARKVSASSSNAIPTDAIQAMILEASSDDERWDAICAASDARCYELEAWTRSRFPDYQRPTLPSLAATLRDVTAATNARPTQRCNSASPMCPRNCRHIHLHDCDEPMRPCERKGYKENVQCV